MVDCDSNEASGLSSFCPILSSTHSACIFQGELRKLVFEKVSNQISDDTPAVINTHATFRWRRGLFPAFTYEELAQLDAELYIVIVDDVDAIKFRLENYEPTSHTYSLKDILVWREEECITTELLSKIGRERSQFYMLHRAEGASLLYKLLFEPTLFKAYISFPISHVQGYPPLVADIKGCRDKIKEQLIAFDPYTLLEKRLDYELKAALQEEEIPDEVKIETRYGSLSMRIDEIRQVRNDIDGQIIARDFKLIDQSELVISYLPDINDNPII
jgi:adenylate kinase